CPRHQPSRGILTSTIRRGSRRFVASLAARASPTSETRRPPLQRLDRPSDRHRLSGCGDDLLGLLDRLLLLLSALLPALFHRPAVGIRLIERAVDRAQPLISKDGDNL